MLLAYALREFELSKADLPNGMAGNRGGGKDAKALPLECFIRCSSLCGNRESNSVFNVYHWIPLFNLTTRSIPPLNL